MTDRHCRYEVDGEILTITIDRPEVLNALHPEAHAELADATADFLSRCLKP